jgi:ABC-type glycerol-3-phosphate transport system substrate-binding protein
MKKIVLVIIISMFYGCAPNSEKIVKVSFWHAMADPKDKTLKELINSFEKAHPNIKIDHQYVGNYDVLLQKLMAGIGAENPPDISQVYENWTTRFKDAGVIVPIENFIKEDGGFTKEDLSDFYPVFINNNSYDKVLWTFPFNKSTYVLFCNESLFRKENLKPPSNMNDFIESCKRLTKKDKSGRIVQYGFGFRANVDIFAIMYYLNGGKFLNENESRVIFNNAAGYEALQLITDLVNKHKTAYYTKDYLDTDFASGKCAMFIATTPHVNELKGLLSFPLEICPLPKWKKQTAPIAGTNLAIYKKNGNGSKIKQRACYEFIKWLVATDNSVRWSIGTSYLPVRKSVLKNETMKEYLSKNPLDIVGIKQLDTAVTDPRITVWQDARIIISESVEKVLLKKAVPKDALNEAVKKINDIISKSK